MSSDAERLRKLLRRRFDSTYYYATKTKPVVHLTELLKGDIAALKRILAREKAREKGKP